jgi:hypothetical protein
MGHVGPCFFVPPHRSTVHSVFRGPTRDALTVSGDISRMQAMLEALKKRV